MELLPVEVLLQNAGYAGEVMSEKIISTVAFKSNLQPVHGSYQTDTQFLESVHDIFSLELLHNSGYILTPLQKNEYSNASLHCVYAYKDDYPFGTVVDEDGKQQVVCRCINTSCSHFQKCRPDFDSNELRVEKENDTFLPEITKMDSLLSDNRTDEELLIQGDLIATVEVFNPSTIIEVKQNVELSNGMGKAFEEPLQEKLTGDSFPLQTDIEKDFSNEHSDATFESFANTEQEEIIMLPASERTIINAGPGTGKTWTLIEKIKYMLSDLEIDPSNILVLCFSRAAVEVIRNRLEAAAGREELPLNWHQLDVRTFDSFATYLLAWLQENIPTLLPEHYTLDNQNYDERIRTASDILSVQKDLLTEYEHIIVDEVQDLVGVRAELVLSILENLSEQCGFTLLGDSCQAIYDYLAVNDSSVMSSEQFYTNLFIKYHDANYLTMNHNYRQGDNFEELSIPYRKAILSGNASSRTIEAKRIDTFLTTSNLNLKEFSPKEANAFAKLGTLGILSRTNGQALQISSWLRAEGIQHSFQRPAQSPDLAVWIANTLVNTETDVIDQSEFEELFARYYPSKVQQSRRYWDALISTQRDQVKTHYEIEDLLRGIYQNARDSLLFEEPEDTSTYITISNIHRAKGREFDSVLVLQDVLENMTNEEKNDLLEHKVCYVALTRPKKRIEKIFLKPQYIYVSKDKTRRCFKAGGFGSKRYLSHFEVGEGSDFNARSFARSPEIQEYIKSLKPDTRLKLLKCPEGIAPYVLYSIVPEDDERMVLGYTTPSFSNGMEWAIKRIFDNYNPIAYKYYPNIFGDVYLDGLTTCISSSDIGIGGAKRFGGMYIWYGLSITGFAQMEKDRY